MNGSCSFCSEPIVISSVTCPHCGQPSLFPNVRIADDPAEIDALEKRSELAKRDVEKNGATVPFEDFLARVVDAEAVINRPLGELTRLTQSDSQLYATFYQRNEAGMQIPKGDGWDTLRALADTALFGDKNKREIRFAALSLDGEGLQHYGECSIALRSAMIAHRASLIEENSAVLLERHRYRLPPGYRASWPRRVALSAAKLGRQFTPATTSAQFASLLLSPGTSSATDEFVEVHVWGSLTIRSIARVIIKQWQLKPRKVEIDALEQKLAKYAVHFVKPG